MSASRTWRVVNTVLLSASALVVVGGAVAGYDLYRHGYRVTTIATPSMSPAIPVQSLVVVAPLHGVAHVGEAVLFDPPGDSWGYVHRIYSVSPGPIYQTKGDNDARPDVWRLAPSNITGRVIAVLPDVGWLIGALPILGGALLIATMVGLIYPRWRRWALVDSMCVAILAADLRLRPFVRWQIITVNERKHHAYVWLFNTGALPIKITSSFARSWSVPAGHPAHIVAPAGKYVTLTGSMDLTGPQWALAAAIVAAPAVVSVIIALKTPRRAVEPPEPQQKSTLVDESGDFVDELPSVRV